MGKDINGYYATLNVDINASDTEIKKAYRHLARMYHPDRENGNEDMFKKIQEAYDTLSNQNKKYMYDNDINIENDQNVHVDIFDLGDLLKNMFNMGESEATTLPQMTLETVKLSLDDVIYGCVKHVEYMKKIKCKHCDDHGLVHSGIIHCLRCNGQGYIPMFPIPTLCPSCNGESVIRQNLQKCKHCDGGYQTNVMKADIKLRSGIKHNEQIKISEELTIVLKHSFKSSYKVLNDDIHFKCVITIEEAILGIDKLIHISSRENVVLKQDECIDNTKPLVIKGRGVCKQDETRGDLVVSFVIVGSRYYDKFVKYRKAFLKIFS